MLQNHSYDSLVKCSTIFLNLWSLILYNIKNAVLQREYAELKQIYNLFSEEYF
ncbi:15012_t:CDS:2 [Entrophospora sp. SA101]|nr:15012_t:CDS:2 [Entrophospora sp. SA101]